MGFSVCVLELCKSLESVSGGAISFTGKARSGRAISESRNVAGIVTVRAESEDS